MIKSIAKNVEIFYEKCIVLFEKQATQGNVSKPSKNFFEGFPVASTFILNFSISYIDVYCKYLGIYIINKEFVYQLATLLPKLLILSHVFLIIEERSDATYILLIATRF